MAPKQGSALALMEMCSRVEARAQGNSVLTEHEIARASKSELGTLLCAGMMRTLITTCIAPTDRAPFVCAALAISQSTSGGHLDERSNEGPISSIDHSDAMQSVRW